MATYTDRAFDALGDPTRRAIFMRLRGGTRSVGDIARGLDVSRPAVSQHLQVLKAARLVTRRAVGTHRFYAVDQDGVRLLRDWLDGFWDTTLAAFKDAAEREAARMKKR